MLRRVDNIIAAIRAYGNYRMYCGYVAMEAQLYINWTDNVNCEYYPSDGLCLNLETDKVYVCPVDSFFLYIEKHNLTSITVGDFKLLCI